MPTYTWKGIKSGAYREGTIEAKNEHEASYLVRKNHVIIFSVENLVGSLEKKKSIKNIFANLLPNEESPKNIKQKDVLVFTKN